MFRSKNTFLNRCGLGIFSLACATSLFFGQSVLVSAADYKEERINAHQAMPIESNQVSGWPQGPVVSAESAILMDADTGAILYAKDIHEHEYPASTTKILTTLIAAEKCSLDETVTFSHDAVFGIPRGSNHIAMNEGDTLTMEQCLNAILIRSANEVSYAVAEHISGTWDAFADLMNQRAKELGCVDSHFVNPNGLPDENHYTSAYDLAMIGRAFFANEMLCRMTTTQQLVIPKAEEDLVEWNKMELLPGHKYAYEYLVGCKTGYTDVARSTLVSCAEKDGMKLICVVLNDEAPYHYEDTISLFNYGFSNFDKINISQTETKYNIDDTGLFYSDNDIFGNSQPILSLNKDDCIILPKTAAFADTVSSISYDTGVENQVALISYTYNDVFVGSASVDLAKSERGEYTFEADGSADSAGETAAADAVLDTTRENTESTSDNTSGNDTRENAPKQTSFIFINIVKVLLWVAGIAAVVFLILLLVAFLRNYQFSRRSTRRRWRRNRRRKSTPYSLNPDSVQARRKAAIRDAKKRQRRKNSGYKFRDYD